MENFKIYEELEIKNMLEDYEDATGEKHPAENEIIKYCWQYVLGDEKTIILSRKSDKKCKAFEYGGAGLFEDNGLSTFLKGGE